MYTCKCSVFLRGFACHLISQTTCISNGIKRNGENIINKNYSSAVVVTYDRNLIATKGYIYNILIFNIKRCTSRVILVCR